MKNNNKKKQKENNERKKILNFEGINSFNFYFGNFIRNYIWNFK